MLLLLFCSISKILETIAKSKRGMQLTTIIISTFLAWNLGVSKFAFSDNFVYKKSAQIQNFTSGHCRKVNLEDCSVLRIELNSKRVLL